MKVIGEGSSLRDTEFVEKFFVECVELRCRTGFLESLCAAVYLLSECNLPANARSAGCF